MLRRASTRLLLVVGSILAVAATKPIPAAAAAGDIVIYAADVSTMRGNWTRGASTTGAGGQLMTSADRGWSSAAAPKANPADYFEATFSAPANTTYRLWLRVRATGDTKWNESVWVQFSDALNPGGAAAYRIGTTSAVLVNLERCSNCGVSGWGWQNTGYWVSQETRVRFPTTGNHTVRVQTREDGVQIDQIILSPTAYMASAPGGPVNDATVVSKTAATPAAAASSSTPFSGTPVALPGTVQAENFDNGGEGVATRDVTAGNVGGAYRSGNVDLAAAGGGGYTVGWTDPGEWLNYTVNVTAAGAYTINFRVASVGQGGAFHLEMNGANVTGSVTVPNTGGWQAWRLVSRTVTLSAGQQRARLVMDTRGPSGGIGNIDSIQFARATTSTPPPPTPSGTSSTLRMMSWNIHGGKNPSNVNVLTQQAALIAQQNVDVVTLNEVVNNGQPTTLKNELQRLTGRTWYTSWAPSCSTSGCLGNLILSRIPIAAGSMILVDPTAFARARIVVNNVPIEVIGTHLGVPTDRRTNELNHLMSWARGFSSPRLIGGDFNSWWGETWITRMKSEYYDTWEDYTGSVQNGHTIGNVRFDYIFRSTASASRVTPTNCFVVSTNLSDHRPVVGVFRVQ
jgi:endonuclease/exonuclease/phosphatase family metal-dependent hydrolase